MLVNGLPPECATFRNGSWTLAEELAAQTLERVDAHLGWVTLKKGERIQIPGRVQLVRPGPAAEPEKPKVITDPREIRAWFAKHA